MTEAQVYAYAQNKHPEADRINVGVVGLSQSFWLVKVYERDGRELELLAKYTMPRTADPA